MIKEFEIKRPRGTYGDSVGKYFDSALKRFSSIGLMVGSCTFDAEKGVTFAKVNDMGNMTIQDPTGNEIDNLLEKYKSVGLSVDGIIMTDGVITVTDVVDTHDW